MNVVLLTGRGGSKSIPGKNVYPLLGRPLAFYPMTAAKRARHVDRIFVSTDSKEIKQVARDLGIEVIDRPPELARDDSELVDAITHALGVIGGGIRYLITMHCNCAVHRPGLVDECITRLDEHPEADSCVTGHVDQSVHPYRTKRIGEGGYLHSWLEIPEGTSTNRQALGECCFILDGAVRVMRVERCFPPRGQRPFTYLGQRILHVINEGRGDVHDVFDLPRAEALLRRAGFEPA
jgi:N-acylneuraminate cytidylyltransferase